MRAQLYASVRRVLSYDVGRPTKAVLFFDVNRVLRWDVGRAMQRPIPARAVLAIVVLWLAIAAVK